MARVEWSRLSGDDVEQALAVMLMQEQPSARLLRAGRGDGGVDVYVPHASRVWTVYQIKKQVGPLDAGIERQIRDSWASTVRFAADNDLTVVEWLLLRPSDSTFKEVEFYEGLTADGPFPCRDAGGLTKCDRLAADHPPVVDYYFHDGRDRVDEQVRSHLRALGLVSRVGQTSDGGGQPMQPLTPATSVEALGAVHDALNVADPHYLFDVHLMTRPAGTRPDDVAWLDLFRPKPLLVARVAHGDGDRAVVFDVTARFAEATTVKPLDISMGVHVAEGSADAAAFADHLAYGTPISDLPVTITSMPLPGGLGIDAPSDATLTTNAAEVPDGATLSVQVWTPGPADGPFAELDMKVVERGDGADGFHLRLRHESGLATLVLILSKSKESEMRWTWPDLTGHPVTTALPIAALRASVHAPNELRVARKGQPVLFTVRELPVPDEDAAPLVDSLRDLATIQQHTFRDITLPIAGDVTVGDVRDWEAVASLLRGQVRYRRVGRLPFETDDPPQVGETVSPLLVQPLVATVNGVGIELGEFATFAVDMTVDTVTTPDGGPSDVVASYGNGERRAATVFWPADRQPRPVPPAPAPAPAPAPE